DPGSRRAEENSSRVILAVFLALLIDLLGFTLILPLLPSILDHFSKNDDGLYRRVQAGVDWFSGSLGIPPERKYNSVLFGGRKFPLLQGGFIGSLFSLLQFLASPLTGAASDSFGRRPALLVTAAMIGLAFSLGFTLGPMLGAFLALETEKDQVFYTRAAIFATIFAVADFLFILTCLPETLPKEKRVILYWLAGAEVCFTVCASLFLLPFVLLRCMPKQSKQE
ncbi:Major facilitator superfamily domain-containing protein 10, partial [Ophiophagus hannah]